MYKTFSLGLLFILNFLQSSSAQNFCIPDYSNSSGNPLRIGEVNLGDLRDTALTAHDTAQYLDYSSVIAVDTNFYLVTTELIRGKNQTLKINANSTTAAFSAWIDYNENGSFEDADEKLGIEYMPDTFGQIQFHIPSWVIPGTKRMRISLAPVSDSLGRRFDFLPCTPIDPTVGQTIDYSIEIHADYCFPFLTSTCDQNFMIDGFEINRMQNLNNGKDLANCHSDFTTDPTLLAELVRGTYDSIKIHFKNLVNPVAYFNMWVDGDDDGEYESYETPISNLSIPVTTTLDTTLVFPVFPVPNETGYKRIRIQVSNSSITNGFEDEACNPFASGEYEDYLIYIGSSVCVPTNSAGTVNGAYINSVTMDATSITSNSGGTVHYQDYYYNPATFINLPPDKNHTLTIQSVNATGNSVYLGAYADFNNDGIFNVESPYENLVLNSNGLDYLTHSTASSLDVLTFRSPSILSDGPVHLRIIVADSTEEFYCSLNNPINIGEIEDYKLIILNDDSLAPIADLIPRLGQGTYTGGAHEFCPGAIQFFDASYHHPDQWHWEFPGGRPSVSDLQNPVVFYDSAGYKSVKLRVTNSFGLDSVSLSNIIYVNSNGIHFRDVTGNLLNDTVVVCSTNNSFYINAADDPYFQSYLWSTSSTDTAVNFTAVLPDTNSIYLTVQTRTAPSCTLKDTLFLIQNSTLQVDLNVSPTANDICASTAFIDTLNCTNSSALLGTYQFSTHFNSDAPTFLNNAGSNPLQLIDTIDLSTHAGGTISFLVSYNAVSGNATNFGCAVVSDSLTLAIHAQPTASLHTLDSSLYCVGATLTTVATSSGGTGSPSYQWSAIGTVLNQNQDSLVLQDISVVPGPIAIQYIYSTNGPGCISDTAVYTEQLLSRPLVQVSTSSDSICNQANLSILGTLNPLFGNGEAGTYEWSWSSDQGANWNILGSGTDTFFVGPFYIPGLSGTDTTVQVRVQFTGAQPELGCMSDPASSNVIIQATPDVTNSSFTESICSGSGLLSPVSLQANIPGSTFQWNFNTGNQVQVTPSSGSTTQINPVFTNTSNQQDTTRLFVTATGPGSTACPGITRSIAFLTINPVPGAPVVSILDSAVCSDAQNVFISVVPQPGIVSIWDSTETTLHELNGVESGGFAVFDFKPVSASTIDSAGVQSQYAFAPECPSATTFAHFTISPEPAPPGDIKIQFQSLGNTLVCMRNDVDGYQWGYDSLPDYQPHLQSGQVFQSCSFGNSFDVTRFYYWVIVTQGNCESKFYYGGDNGEFLPPYVRNSVVPLPVKGFPLLEVFPNPNNGEFTVSLKNFTGTYANLQVYDAIGKCVRKQDMDLNQSNEYHLVLKDNNLRKGIYWLRVNTSQEESALVSFIIQ